MRGQRDRYHLSTQLAKKYSHSTYLASPISNPEHQVVLIAFDPSLSFAFPREYESFLQKAQSIKKLHHPYLLPILDIGIEEEQPFVVRDYLSNGSLRSQLKRISPQKLELQQALNIVLQVGEALAYAHGQDIFHGNVKPENVLFDVNGQARLTDFTLTSKMNTMLRDQTSEEYAFCYMAPEQFAGTWDARSDQYALGCLTYELITGKNPFAAQTLSSIMGQHNNLQPIPLSERVPNLLPSLEDAVLKTLAKEPGERFSDFSLFLEVIRSDPSPPLVFPFAHFTASRKSRTLSRPARPPKAGTFLSSLHQLDVSADPLPEPPEAEVLQQSEGLIPSKENGDDLWLSKKIAEQERSDPSAAGFADRELEPYESSTGKVDEMIVPLPKSDNRDRPLKRHTWHKSSKLLGLMFLCFVIIASGIYAVLLPLRGASKPDLPVHLTQAVRQMPVVPAQNSILPTPLTVLATPTVPAIPTAPVQPTPQPTLTASRVIPGLVGYWPLNEGSGTTVQDASGNGHSAQINGATWSTGRIGDALSFKGSSDTVDTNQPIVNTSASYTVAAWVQLSSLNAWHTAVSQDGNYVSGFYLQVTPDNQFAFSLLSADSKPLTTTRATSNFTLTANVWYHLVGIYDATTTQSSLYVNGVLRSTQTVPPAWNAHGETVIGRAVNGHDPWSGKIDDVRLYNRALSATDVTNLYASFN